jgi:formate hydrogenlyase subunit 3/multisubunit Na+/H+ antiporter MnhD subunit
MLHAIFTLITTIATELPGKPLVDLNDLKLVTGLDARFVVYFLIIFFSFAGVPPLAGFFIKAFVIESLVLIDALGTLLFVVVMVVINAYLYLRIINIVLFEERTADFVVRLRWLQQPLYYQGAVNLGGASSESAPLTYSYSDFYTPLFFLSVFLITFFCYLGAFFDFMTHFMVLLLIFS